MPKIDLPTHIRNRRRRTLSAPTLCAVIALTLVGGSTAADAAPPKPTLVSEVAFVIPASPRAGIPVDGAATIGNLPSTVNANDIIAWATCQTAGASVPSAFTVRKTVDHASRRLLLTVAIDSGKAEQDCVLRVVPTAIGAHVAFFPSTNDPDSGTALIEGDYIVDGITVGS